MIRLVGPGGAGKSTVGAALAARLGCPFHDLDREFERRRGDIDAFIAARGYPAYARENVSVYLELAPRLPGSVAALSSGFMVYPAAVHPAYPVVTEAVARSRSTVVLLPSLDRESCVAETVRRQLGRPFGRRGAAREEAVIRERFDRYVALPAMKVETMRPPHEVAAAIHARLAAEAPEALPGRTARHLLRMGSVRTLASEALARSRCPTTLGEVRMIRVETVSHFNEDAMSHGLALGFADRLREALQDLHCQGHEADVTIRVSTEGIAQTPNDISIDIDGCCEAAVERVREVVEATRGTPPDLT